MIERRNCRLSFSLDSTLNPGFLLVQPCFRGILRANNMLGKTTAPASRPLGRFLPNPKLKLREQLAEVCRFRHMSPRSENAYWHWLKGFIQFHRRQENSFNARPHPGPLPHGAGVGWRHPREMGVPEVQAYLSHLAVARDVSVATQRQALNAIVFLYSSVLQIELGEFEEWVRARQPRRVPLVLSREEVGHLPGALVRKPATTGPYS